MEIEIVSANNVQRELAPEMYRPMEQMEYGSANVCKAMDLEHRTIILKQPEYLEDIERILNEQKILRGLMHPSIQRLVDYSDEGPLYSAFEYVQGQTLGDHLAMISPERMPMEFYKHLAETLNFLHEKGIAHKGLSTGNVLVTQSRPYLVGFGDATIGGFEEDVRQLGILMLMGIDYEATVQYGSKLRLDKILKGERDELKSMIYQMLDDEEMRPEMDEVLLAFDMMGI